MGRGATNTVARMAASLGVGEAVAVTFHAARDVPYGGVLLALPALLVSGLLRDVASYFQLPRGYYALPSLFLLQALMALARLKSLEDLRYCAPGEWGTLLGLDRIPEVRTLRAKLGYLAAHGQPREWSTRLCQDWLEATPEHAEVLYIDGHVRVYHGHQTPLPRHYVARQRLCLRATTDYWVNALDGQPFLRVTKAVDPGLLQVLEQDLIPRLEQDLPALPSAAQLEADPLRHRFTLVFDREGYSPAFLRQLKQRRIACLTYRKYPGEDWPGEEFHRYPVTLASGQSTEMKLAERGVLLGDQVWVRELRKLTDSGHQTAILATDYQSELAPLAAAMFARWSQENFFKYMRQHYHLDRLVDYQTEPLPDTTRVVNPDCRRLDKQVRSTAAKLNRRLAKVGALTVSGDHASATETAQLHAEITQLQAELQTLKGERHALDYHITLADLPNDARFDRLSTDRRQLVDTIKMIAYRAETAMAQTLRETLARHDDARRLLRALYHTEADLLPDEQAGTLAVRLHPLANQSADEAVHHLCAELNATETVFPGTQLRLVYDLVSV